MKLLLLLRSSLSSLALAAMILWGGNAPAETSSASANNLKIDIPYQGIGIGMAPLWIAIDTGLFRHYGVDATTELLAQSPTIIASVLSGETLFANVGEDAVIAADLNGADIVILATGTDKPLFTIQAVSSVHSVAELKGKRLAISQFGTTTDFIARYVIGKAGLTAGSDVAILPVGSMESRLSTLSSGATDAAVLGDATIFKPELVVSFNKIADMLDYDLPFYTTALVAKKSWVDSHRADTLKVVQGYVAGVAALYTDKKAAIAILAKYARTADPAALEGAYALALRTQPKIPAPQPGALQTGLAMSGLPQAKHADPTSYIDASFVDTLQRDGFIDRLYKLQE